MIYDNKYKLFLIIVVIIAGCFSVAYLSKNNQSNIINQRECSKHAEEVFNKHKEDNIASNYSSGVYTNHYSKKMNGCFVLISVGKMSIEYDSTLYNAFENKQLGNVHTILDTAVSCGLQIGDSYESCGNILEEKSSFSAVAEFNNLTKVYMED